MVATKTSMLFSRNRWATFLLLICGALSAEASSNIFWPTPNASYFEGERLDSSLQPTQSGKLESALFGCVRENGRRFHEGLDLKPIGRDSRGEATDAIFAITFGRVAYINKKAGNSSYGRYIVIEHTQWDVPVYTLYSHLARVDEDIFVGKMVQGGDRIGVMGRSAGGYSIPKSRAHLHFEIGLRKSSQFDSWHDWRKLSGKNHHGNYNGLNLIGMDPVRFYEQVRSGRFESFEKYIKNLPTAFKMRIATRRVPDFIARYPALMTRRVQTKDVVGWDIEFTWYGLPKRWTPLLKNEVPTSKEGTLSLLEYDADAFAGHCRKTLVFGKKGVQLGQSLKHDIQLIFGFR